MHEKKKLPGFTQAPTSPRKVCDENESRKKQRAPKIFSDGRKEFIRHYIHAKIIWLMRVYIINHFHHLANFLKSRD